ncbi:hypothetical protein F383_07607 [Gossypium arboreum]|uniref:Uncharacterized protein n=1 Tax=Gossypium arboreum TaxID=29729 RepID=A0A0B0NMV9_GOSAR|nr:hypothetical protein F383_07607 [Gossypium arboreum]
MSTSTKQYEKKTEYALIHGLTNMHHLSTR